MKLTINIHNDKEIARVTIFTNELTGEKKVFKGWLNTKTSEDGKVFKFCDLDLDTTVDEFGKYIKK